MRHCSERPRFASFEICGLWSPVCRSLQFCHEQGQRENVKCCAKPEKSATETLSILWQAYVDKAMDPLQYFEWHECFKDGRRLLKDDERSGRSNTSIISINVEKLHQFVHENYRGTTNNVLKYLSGDIWWKLSDRDISNNWILHDESREIISFISPWDSVYVAIELFWLSFSNARTT